MVDAYYSMIERVLKQKAAIVIAQLGPEVKLTAREQLAPGTGS